MSRRNYQVQKNRDKFKGGFIYKNEKACLNCENFIRTNELDIIYTEGYCCMNDFKAQEDAYCDSFWKKEEIS